MASLSPDGVTLPLDEAGDDLTYFSKISDVSVTGPEDKPLLCITQRSCGTPAGGRKKCRDVVARCAGLGGAVGRDPVSGLIMHKVTLP